MQEIASSVGHSSHSAGTFPSEVLDKIENLLPSKIRYSAETGCGKSTILLSRLAERHTVFCLDDRAAGELSSVNFYNNSKFTRHAAIREVWGPTQTTLPNFTDHDLYDFVLIDGPHGYPFPEIEYYYFYPHIRTGGMLVVDDVHIPTIGRMADFLQEDDMFSLLEIIGTTAIFRRSSMPLFDPLGDGWWTQKFNRRRTPSTHEFHLADHQQRPLISTAFASVCESTNLHLTVSSAEGRKEFRRVARRACRGMSPLAKLAFFWPIIRTNSS